MTVTPETVRAHRMTWYVYAGSQRIRHQATMRGSWGYDAVCSCGNFDSRTGGAVKRYVDDLVWQHRHDAQREEGTR